MSKCFEQIQQDTWTKFAVAALNAIVAINHKDRSVEDDAAIAAQYADAMIKEWEKR